MVFEWITPARISLNLALSIQGYLMLAIYILAALAVLFRLRDELGRLRTAQWLALGGLVITAFGLAGCLVFTVGSASFSLVGLLAPLAAGLFLGRGAAWLVGLGAGLGSTLLVTGHLTHPLELALLGSAAAALLTQRHRGQLGELLRQPLVAAVVAAIFVGWPLTLLGLFALGDGPVLASLERTISAMLPWAGVYSAAALLAGALFQGLVLRRPDLQPIHAEDLAIPPWEQRLSQRILFSLVPLLVLATILLVGLAALVSYQVATRLVVSEMSRDALTVSSGIPFYVQAGRGLIRDLASDKELVRGDDSTRADRLVASLRAVPFFQQLIYFNAAGEQTGVYPVEGEGVFDPALTAEEAVRVQLALQQDFSAEVTIDAPGEPDFVVMSFITTVPDPDGGEPAGVLVGRTRLETNPVLRPVVETLQAGLIETGEGFLIDDQNRILMYPAHPDRQGQAFQLGRASEIPSRSSSGQAFRRLNVDGTRDLVYLLPVTGRSDWSVVVVVPNQVALALAVQIALPMLLLLLALSGSALPLVVMAAKRITGPLDDLLIAAEMMSHGELDRPVEVAGEDEIGRLGTAFEQMRQRLKQRLGEQERLLSVSRSVSSSLELFRSMPSILNSALDVTAAAGVRIVLRGEFDQPPQTYAAGDAAGAMAVLDSQLIDLVERQGAVVISQIWRATGTLDVSILAPHIQALVAFPLRSEQSFHGVLWLAYDEERIFEQSEMNYLATLAGQAAVAVSNARLFGRAQEERRKLQTVLESTADGMIVVDNEGRIMMINPAAEKLFEIRAEQVHGRKATEVIAQPHLARLLTSLQEPVEAVELPGRNGATLLANTSTIVAEDGAIAGRVALLRDVTALKELDTLKTIFLRMVSHDLKSPLTYIKGYLSMLPLTGDLNQRQHEAIAKIEVGIEQITQMTERLTYLSRLQFGEEARLDLMHIDVEQVLREIFVEHQDEAVRRQITLSMDVQKDLPLLEADPVLYRQAVANLVSNALKYVQEGGHVYLQAVSVDGSAITVSVGDDGPGIREEDQGRLFEAFYRVPQREGEPPRPKGSGLGLALVKAIADAHGGSVSLSSTFGVGSTFTITLPIKQRRKT